MKQSIRTKKDYKLLTDERDLTVVSLLILAGAVIFLSISLFFSIQGNKNLKSPVYLVKPNDEIEIATPGSNQHRDKKAIARLAESWLKMSYEWDLHNPDNQDTPCVSEIKAIDSVVPCKVHDASFLLSPPIRNRFLYLIARDIVKKGVYGENKVFSLVDIFLTNNFKKRGPDTYSIDIIASRIDLKESISPSGLEVREEIDDEILNNRIFLQSIPSDRLVLPDLEQVAYRRKIHSLLSAGLIITDIKPIQIPLKFRKSELKVTRGRSSSNDR